MRYFWPIVIVVMYLVGLALHIACLLALIELGRFLLGYT